MNFYQVADEVFDIDLGMGCCICVLGRSTELSIAIVELGGGMR